MINRMNNTTIKAKPPPYPPLICNPPFSIDDISYSIHHNMEGRMTFFINLYCFMGFFGLSMNFFARFIFSFFPNSLSLSDSVSISTCRNNSPAAYASSKALWWVKDIFLKDARVPNL